MQNRKEIENAMYLLMLAKYFEKIADHSASIAYTVDFSITGKQKGKQAEGEHF